MVGNANDLHDKIFIWDRKTSFLGIQILSELFIALILFWLLHIRKTERCVSPWSPAIINESYNANISQIIVIIIVHAKHL